MAMAAKHRASALKQQNKKHKVLGHRTKGQLTKANKGMASGEIPLGLMDECFFLWALCIGW